MIVLSFDIAMKTGWAVGDTEFGIEKGGSFSCKSYVDAYKHFNELITLWKPELIITAAPTRFYKTIRKLSQIAGVMLYLAEKNKCEVYTETTEARGKKRSSTDWPNDSTMKGAVFGKGVVSKQEICRRYKTKDEDYADACMFFDYICIKLKQ